MKSQTKTVIIIGLICAVIALGFWYFKNKHSFGPEGRGRAVLNSSEHSISQHGEDTIPKKLNDLDSAELDQSKQAFDQDNTLSFQRSYTQKIYKNHTARGTQYSVLKGGGSSYRLMEFSRGIGALLAMYDATESSQYIEEALDLSENIITKTKKGKNIANNPKIFRDDYRGWINNNPGYKDHKRRAPHRREIPLYESYLFRYLAKMAYMVENSTTIPTNSPLRKRSGEIQNFIEVNGWEKWYKRGEKKSKGCYPYLFRSRTHMTSHWAIVALYLRELTNSPEKREQYSLFLSLYDKQLRGNFQLTKDGAYIWNMTWDHPWPWQSACNKASEKSIIQDVSHGNHVVTYLVEAYEMQHGGWTKKDMQRLANTVKYVLYDEKNKKFNAHLDGKFDPEMANGVQMADGFIKLARYDKELLDVFEFVRENQNPESYEFSLYEPEYVAELGLARKYHSGTQ